MPPGIFDGFDETSVKREGGRQMGCMAGFFHMFDRSQFLGGRRVSSRKRLPCVTSAQPSAALNPSCSSSPMVSISGTLQEENMVADAERQVPATENIKKPVVVLCRDRPRSSFDMRDVVRDSVFRDVAKSPEKKPKENLEEPKVCDLKGGLLSSWRTREVPRLSLDSRAAMRSSVRLFPREIRTRLVQPEGSMDEPDDVERQRRSPSVVARLMGLDVMPDFDASGGAGANGFTSMELRRSASESRVSRELLGWRADGETQQRRQRQTGAEWSESIGRDMGAAPAKEPRLFQQSKGFESAEVFPDARRSGNLYGEIERRLKLRGINNPGNDLETLKQILDALQFKGLLHSMKSGARYGQEHRNFVYDERKPIDAEPPVAAVRPSPPSPPRSVHRSHGTESSTRLKVVNSRISASGRKQTVMEPLPPSKTRKNRPAPAADELGLRNVRTSTSMPPRSPGRGRDSERNSPRQMRSPPRAVTARRATPESSIARSPGRRKQVERDLFPTKSPSEEHQPPTVWKNRGSTTYPMSSEKSPTQKKDECGESRILVDRCDKEAMEQPSPVSVLDAPFRSEDSSLSPATKRSIDLADDYFFENVGGSVLHLKESPLSAFTEDEIRDTDSDEFRYVSDVVLASEKLLQSTAWKSSAVVFSLLESRRRPDPGESDNRRIHRRLVFDTVMEILQRKRHQRAEAYVVGRRLLRQIWTEFRRTQRLVAAVDLCDMVSGVIHKDLFGMDGWTAAGTADAVLDIERLIFKDLVVDTIRQLAFPTVGESPNHIPKAAAVRTTPTKSGLAPPHRHASSRHMD